jgi:hypothetical protein
MRKSFVFAALLCVTAFAGCDSGKAVVTDPSQLKPLTEEEKAEIRKLDDQIIEAEGGTTYGQKKSAAKQK